MLQVEVSAMKKIVPAYETPRRKNLFLSINLSTARLFYLEFNFILRCFLIANSKRKTIKFY